MADIFAVIADPTRRELLRVLLDRRTALARGDGAVERFAAAETGVGEISVGEMVAELSLSQPTVSKHLRVLRDSGLVHVREKGQHRYYSLESAPLHDVEAWLQPFLPPVSSSGVLGENAVETGPTSTDAGSGSWPNVPVPAPLRRAAENLPDATDVAAALGRAVAGAQSRIPEPVKKRLGRRD